MFLGKINFWIMILVFLVSVMMPTMTGARNERDMEKGDIRSADVVDSVELNTVFVLSKSKSQEIRESSYSVSVADVRSQISTVSDLTEVVSKMSGVNIRTEGGLGSDYTLSVNGMSGNSVRYFVDGVPMSTLGSGMTLSNIPLGSIERVEVYKGVVPVYLGGDALGGAVNIVTRRTPKDFLDCSVSAGSFDTYRGDVKSQFHVGGTGLLIRPSVNIDYSKNNYKVHNVEVWNEAEEIYDTVSRRRFHDEYFSFSGQLDVGVERKAWADRFFVGVTYADMRKQLQTGSVQSIVYGKAQRKQHAFGVHLDYDKRRFLTDNLRLMLRLSHTWDHSVTIDTAFQRYDWNGDYVVSSRNETNGKARQYRHYKRPLTVIRMNLGYDICYNHSVGLNYMLSRTGNNRYDTASDYYSDSHDYDASFIPSEDLLDKHILGLGYDQSFWGGRLSNTFFLKNYITHVDVEQSDLAWITHSDDVTSHTVKYNLGYGAGTKYVFCDLLSLKASYERAVRLPEAKELLGNGTTVYPNVSLKPEQSHNVNVGLFGSKSLGGGNVLRYEVDAFLRKTEDYIHLTVNESDGTAQYENINDVTTKGFEGEMRFDAGQWLSCGVNASYEESLDMEKYLDSGNRSATYKNRIPNKPWLYGNADVSFTLRDLISRDDKLRLRYDFQYTHWFYLTWEAYGYKPAKARIPSQYVSSAALTYYWKRDRYSLTLSCDNIFDNLSYDNYKMQKPGRSVMAKFRLSIN